MIKRGAKTIQSTKYKEDLVDEKALILTLIFLSIFLILGVLYVFKFVSYSRIFSAVIITSLLVSLFLINYSFRKIIDDERIKLLYLDKLRVNLILIFVLVIFCYCIRVLYEYYFIAASILIVISVMIVLYMIIDSILVIIKTVDYLKIKRYKLPAI